MEEDLYYNDWPLFSPHDIERRKCTISAVKLMLNAAMTAPNAGGVSQVEAHIVAGYRKQIDLAKKMEEIGNENNTLERIFKYEAQMCRESDAVLLLGDYRAAETPMDASCGGCAGLPDCSWIYNNRHVAAGQIDMSHTNPKRMVDGPLCSVRVGDLGYAVGSALYLAKTLFVDARPFMSVGVAAQKMGYCPDSKLVIGVLAASLSKNPYVDVNTDYHVVNLWKLMDSLRKQYALERQAGGDYRFDDPGEALEKERRKKRAADKDKKEG
jgi:uncharacterized ferredoxin-like protein